MGAASVRPRRVSRRQTRACINDVRAGFALERFDARTPRVAFSGIIAAAAVLATGGGSGRPPRPAIPFGVRIQPCLAARV